MLRALSQQEAYPVEPSDDCSSKLHRLYEAPSNYLGTYITSQTQEHSAVLAVRKAIQKASWGLEFVV